MIFAFCARFSAFRIDFRPFCCIAFLIFSIYPPHKLHYNPGRLWTYFADAFGIAMILITITGLAMLKGKNGLWGKGGIEFGIGILIPVIILLVM